MFNLRVLTKVFFGFYGGVLLCVIGYSERYFNDGINTDVLSKEITCYNKIQSDMFCGHIKSR